VPAYCYKQDVALGDTITCDRRIAAPDGAYTFSAEASESCGACTCAPDASGSCVDNNAQISQSALQLTASVDTTLPANGVTIVFQ
jgi:hypothetical protein